MPKEEVSHLEERSLLSEGMIFENCNMMALGGSDFNLKGS